MMKKMLKEKGNFNESLSQDKAKGKEYDYQALSHKNCQKLGEIFKLLKQNAKMNINEGSKRVLETFQRVKYLIQDYVSYSRKDIDNKLQKVIKDLPTEQKELRENHFERLSKLKDCSVMVEKLSQIVEQFIPGQEERRVENKRVRFRIIMSVKFQFPQSNLYSQTYIYLVLRCATGELEVNDQILENLDNLIQQIKQIREYFGKSLQIYCRKIKGVFSFLLTQTHNLNEIIKKDKKFPPNQIKIRCEEAKHQLQALIRFIAEQTDSFLKDKRGYQGSANKAELFYSWQKSLQFLWTILNEVDRVQLKKDTKRAIEKQKENLSQFTKEILRAIKKEIKHFFSYEVVKMLSTDFSTPSPQQSTSDTAVRKNTISKLKRKAQKLFLTMDKKIFAEILGYNDAQSQQWKKQIQDEIEYIKQKMQTQFSKEVKSLISEVKVKECYNIITMCTQLIPFDKFKQRQSKQFSRMSRQMLSELKEQLINQNLDIGSIVIDSIGEQKKGGEISNFKNICRIYKSLPRNSVFQDKLTKFEAKLNANIKQKKKKIEKIFLKHDLKQKILQSIPILTQAIGEFLQLARLLGEINELDSLKQNKNQQSHSFINKLSKKYNQILVSCEKEISKLIKQNKQDNAYKASDIMLDFEMLFYYNSQLKDQVQKITQKEFEVFGYRLLNQYYQQRNDS